MKKLSDFADDDIALEGEKVQIETILDKEIVIKKCRFTKSKFEGRHGDYLTLQFSFLESKELKILFTGSEVIINQMRRYEGELPFAARVIKINRYFALK